MRKLSFLFAAIPFLFLGGTLTDQAPDPEESMRPWDLQLEGTIGKDIGVTFLLNKIDAQNVAYSGDCFKVRGKYMYKQYLQEIELEGEVCPAESKFELWHDKGGEGEEHFIGGLSGFLRDWDGQWSQTSSGKKLKLALQETEFIVGEKNRAAFLEKINEDLAEIEDVENMSISEAGVDDVGGFINGIKFPWGGEVEFFSCTRFEYYTSYTSTMRSSYDKYVYQMLDIEHDLYLAWLHYDSDYDKDEGLSFTGYEIQIYRWVDGSWEFETEDVLPKGFPVTQMFEEDVHLDVEISFDRLRLDWGKEKRLFKWNGQSFYR